MEDQGDVRRGTYPHAEAAGNAAENIETARQKLAQAKAKENASVASREYNLSSEALKDYQEVVLLSKQNIKDLYSRSGVEIRDEDFAELHLLRPQLSGGQKKEMGTYISNIHSAYVPVVGGASFFEDAVAIYHELLHSVGRHAEVVMEGGESFGGQSGYATIVKEGVIKRSMGKVPEEGMATYFANKFALESNSETMKRARANYVQHAESNRELGNEDRNKVSRMNQQEKEDYICRVMIQKKQPPEYTNAERLIGALIQGAARSDQDPSTGPQMEASLLRSRVLTQNRSDLMQRIDSAFGDGTTREIFRLGFDSPYKIESVVRKLESQVYGQ